MRGFPLALAAALVASLAFNAVLYRRTADPEGPIERKAGGREIPAPMSAAPALAPASGATPGSALLLAEIRQLRAELAAARPAENAPSGGERAPSRKAQEELPPAIAQDPVVVNALAERDAVRHGLSRYWRDVDRLYEVKDAIGLPKYREVMARLTADFLALDPSSASGFVTASTQAAQEFDRAEADRKEAVDKLKSSVPDKEARKRLEDGIDTRYAEQKQAAIARLDAFLHGTPLQQDLRGKSGGRFLEYLRGR